MTTELEKQFFNTFGIEPCFRNWQQYNFGRVKDGLKLFPERQKLADEGYIKITCKKLEPSKDNDCIYWEEYHYPQITDKRYIELYCVLCDVFNLFDVYRYPVITFRVKDFKENVLKELIQANKYYKQEYIKNQIQKIFI